MPASIFDPFLKWLWKNNYTYMEGIVSDEKTKHPQTKALVASS